VDYALWIDYSRTRRSNLVYEFCVSCMSCMSCMYVFSFFAAVFFGCKTVSEIFAKACGISFKVKHEVGPQDTRFQGTPRWFLSSKEKELVASNERTKKGIGKKNLQEDIARRNRGQLAPHSIATVTVK
jgi:hypothetical protein